MKSWGSRNCQFAFFKRQFPRANFEFVWSCNFWKIYCVSVRDNFQVRLQCLITFELNKGKPCRKCEFLDCHHTSWFWKFQNFWKFAAYSFTPMEAESFKLVATFRNFEQNFFCSGRNIRRLMYVLCKIVRISRPTILIWAKVFNKSFKSSSLIYFFVK